MLNSAGTRLAVAKSARSWTAEKGREKGCGYLVGNGNVAANTPLLASINMCNWPVEISVGRFRERLPFFCG